MEDDGQGYVIVGFICFLIGILLTAGIYEYGDSRNLDLSDYAEGVCDSKGLHVQSANWFYDEKYEQDMPRIICTNATSVANGYLLVEG